MGKIYKNQGKLRFTDDTGIDLSTANGQVMKYRKPDAAEGEWAATVTDTTKIYHDIVDGDLDQSGAWARWAYITLSDDSEVAGEPIFFKVYNEGN